MSKAFTKEDVDPPERSGRLRSVSGLPPGATNYITPGGMHRLQRELLKLRASDEDHAERIAQIEQILASATVVEPPGASDRSVGFGARVTVEDAAHQRKSYRILGMDELDFDPDSLSWISPLGRDLLAAKLGDRITTAETGPVTIVQIEYPLPG